MCVIAWLVDAVTMRIWKKVQILTCHLEGIAAEQSLKSPEERLSKVTCSISSYIMSKLCVGNNGVISLCKNVIRILAIRWGRMWSLPSTQIWQACMNFSISPIVCSCPVGLWVTMRIGTAGDGRNGILKDPRFFSYIVISNRRKCWWSMFVNLAHLSEHIFLRSLRI